MSSSTSNEPPLPGETAVNLRELSFLESEQILKRGRIAHLAMRDAEGAYIVTVVYVYANGYLFGHAASGRKVTLMRRWPHVSLLVEEVENLHRWRSVQVRGRYEEIHDEAEKQHARLLLVRAFEGNLMSVTAGHGHRTSLADAVLFRVRPEEITGRSQG